MFWQTLVLVIFLYWSNHWRVVVLWYFDKMYFYFVLNTYSFLFLAKSTKNNKFDALTQENLRSMGVITYELSLPRIIFHHHFLRQQPCSTRHRRYLRIYPSLREMKLRVNHHGNCLAYFSISYFSIFRIQVGIHTTIHILHQLWHYWQLIMHMLDIGMCFNKHVLR